MLLEKKQNKTKHCFFFFHMMFVQENEIVMLKSMMLIFT